MRFFYAFVFSFLFINIHAQNTDTLPPAPSNDTLGQAPEYDIDMRILDEYGFFNSTNAKRSVMQPMGAQNSTNFW